MMAAVVQNINCCNYQSIANLFASVGLELFQSICVNGNTFLSFKTLTMCPPYRYLIALKFKLQHGKYVRNVIQESAFPSMSVSPDPSPFPPIFGSMLAFVAYAGSFVFQLHTFNFRMKKRKIKTISNPNPKTAEFMISPSQFRWQSFVQVLTSTPQTGWKSLVQPQSFLLFLARGPIHFPDASSKQLDVRMKSTEMVKNESLFKNSIPAWFF